MAGLGAAYELTKQAKCTVTVYEKAPELGGLASSTKIQNVPIESFYHHLFPTYHDFFEVIEEIGVPNTIAFRKSPVATYVRGTIYPFSGALDLLRFSPLSLFNRIKTGLLVLYLKRRKDWSSFESVSAHDWLQKHFGESIYEVLWEPLLKSKFGDYYKKVSMVWFWGRIYERPSSFGYFVNGFRGFVNALESYLQGKGVLFKTGVSVDKITKRGETYTITVAGETNAFDKVIVASPPSAFSRMMPGILSEEELEKARGISYLGNICLILSLKEKLSPYYWTNINDTNMPFVVVVEQTNLVPDNAYNGVHPVYVSRYIDVSDPLYALDDEEIFALFTKHLAQVHPHFTKNAVDSFQVFRAPYTQQVVQVGYGKKKPHFKTGDPGVWWVSMSHIYPWDRGTNHSFRAGRELVREMFGIIEKNVPNTPNMYVAAIIGAISGGLAIVPILSTGVIHSVLAASTLVPVLSFLSVLGIAVANRSEKWIPSAAQMMKFSIVGSLSTLIELFILNILFILTGITSGIGFSFFKSFTFLVALLNSYILNKTWTFKVKNTSFRPEFLKFALSNILGLVLNVTTASLVVNTIGPQFGISSLGWANVGAIVAVVVTMTWNFLSYKFLVFKK